MSVKVKIPTQLRELVGGQKELDVVGAATIRELLEKIGADFPAAEERIRDEQGEIRRFVNVFVGDEDVRFLQGLATEIADGVVVSILPAVAGGSDWAEMLGTT